MNEILKMNKTRRFGFHVGTFARFFLFCCFWSTSVVAAATLPAPHYDDGQHEYVCLQADRQIDVVLSHYKEDLGSVQSKLEHAHRCCCCAPCRKKVP
jgi:hypothetical protein